MGYDSAEKTNLNYERGLIIAKVVYNSDQSLICFS
jgi:hypothetical protein